MPELTDTELIATRLLGWRKIETPEDCKLRFTWYERGEDVAGVNQYGCCLGGSADGGDQWPEFEKERERDYWVRRMEDALAEKGLLMLITEPHLSGYVRKLLEEYRSTNPDANYYEAALRATAPQRVAACVKVLREVQG